MRILFICGALAAGEYAAASVPFVSEAWPVAATLAALTVLWGYALRVRGWPLAAVFLLGFALFLRASVESERLYRERPWLRGRLRYERQAGAPRGRLASLAKADLSRRVGIGLAHDREVAGLNRAILLGERFRLPRQSKQTFVASGAMHVFAISGLHVMAVAGVLTLMLSLTLVPRRLVGVLVLPPLWGYVGLVGAAPSAVRAALMGSFCLVAPVFWRRPNLLRAWALTFLLVHAACPLMIVNVGNALSFAVMLSIALLSEWGRRRKVRVSFVWVTVVAWATGVPIGAHVFGQVTPGGILANLVLVTAAGWAVCAAAVGVLVSYVSETAAAHVNNLSALCTKAMVGVTEVVSRLPGSNFEVTPWTPFQCAEWYAALVLACLLLAWIRSRRVW